MIKISNLFKRYGDQDVIKDLNIELTCSGMIGLVGPDGAGKTTLMRLLTGLLLPSAGDISIFDLDTEKDAGKIHEIIGYMPQQFGLYEDLTVLENLKLYADLKNVVGHKREEQFKSLLEFTSLGAFVDRLSGKMSGGMKQKLGLACALLGNPKLLLLDEPSVGVDPVSRRELLKMVQGLLDTGMTVIWSTAYLDEAEKFDRVLLLNEGEMLFSGKPADFLTRVQGRTYLLVGVPEDKRRSLLLNLSEEKTLVDSIIEGDFIRLVTSEKINDSGMADLHALIESITGQTVEIKEIAPRFEDSFMDILSDAEAEPALLVHGVASPNSDKAVVVAENLTKKFGSFTAVNNVSFKINRGEIFGLLGPNGAGKSTTFKMMCGLLQTTSGSAAISGIDLKTSGSMARGRIGYMAQKFSLYGNLSVKQNLAFFAGLYGLKKKEKASQIKRMIEIFDLGIYVNTSSASLPLGFKQRLSLACAIMHQPDVLFLDEPTSGVDPLTRREFWNHINSMVEQGVTIMVTTHFMDEAEYCDRIGLIYHGKNIATGSPSQLRAKALETGAKNINNFEDTFIALVTSEDVERAEGQVQ